MKLLKKSTILPLVAIIVVLGAVGFSYGLEITVVLPEKPETGFIRSRMPIFEEDTGVNIFLTTYAEGLYREHVISDLVAGAGTYDIAAVDSVHIPMLAEAGMIEPIEEIFEVGEKIKEYNPLVLDTLSHEDTLYALPYTREVSLLFYRKDLFDELGLKAPQTFAEIESHAEKLYHFPDIYPFAARAAAGEGNNVFSWTHLLHAFGGEFFDADMEPVFDSEEAVAATEQYADLLEVFAPEPLTELDQWRIETMFALGAIGMTIESHDLYGRLESPVLSRVAGNVGYAQVPEGPAGRYPGNRIFGLVAASHEPPEIGNPGEEERHEALESFLHWVTSREMEQDMWNLASITSSCRDDFFMDSDFQERVRNDWLEATLESFEQTSLDFRPHITEWYMVGDRFSIALEGVVAGMHTAREALTWEREHLLEERERMQMIEENE